MIGAMHDALSLNPAFLFPGNEHDWPHWISIALSIDVQHYLLLVFIDVQDYVV